MGECGGQEDPEQEALVFRLLFVAATSGMCCFSSSSMEEKLEHFSFCLYIFLIQTLFPLLVIFQLYFNTTELFFNKQISVIFAFVL